jgi:hypothetical protein
LLAAQNGHTEVARLLLESKADITTNVNQVLITSSKAKNQFVLEPITSKFNHPQHPSTTLNYCFPTKGHCKEVKRDVRIFRQDVVAIQLSYT